MLTKNIAFKRNVLYFFQERRKPDNFFRARKKVKTKQNKNTMTTSEYLCFVILENNSQESRRMMIKMRNIENGKRERNERARYRLAGGAAITCQKTRGLLNLWGVSFRVLWSGEALNLH